MSKPPTTANSDRLQAARTRNLKPWRKGQSGNPAGRPPGERALLQRLYGENGEEAYAGLKALRASPKTPTKLKAEIDMFIIERLHGRAQQHVELAGGVDFLALVLAAARTIEGGSDGQ